MEDFRYSAVSAASAFRAFTSFAGSGGAARMVTSDLPLPRSL
jgi:hypothetical protein